MGYFFKQNTMASIKKYMNSKGLYEKAVNDTLKEINYQKKNLSYKPKGFLDKLFPNLLQNSIDASAWVKWFLKGLIAPKQAIFRVSLSKSLLKGFKSSG